MSRPNYNVKSSYLGAGNQKVYSFNFKIIDPSQLRIIHRDKDNELVFDTTGDDLVNIPAVIFNEAGGTIELVDNLPVDDVLVILFADDNPVQPQRFSNAAQLKLKQLENALDRLNGPQQKLFYWLLNRVPKIDDAWLKPFDSNIPEPYEGGLLGFNETGTAFKAFRPGEFEGPPGPQGNPIFLGEGDPNDITFDPSPNNGDSYVDTLDAQIWRYSLAGAEWIATGEFFPTGAVNIQGFSRRYNQAVSFTTAQSAFEFVFDLGYQPQEITSFTSAGSATTYEKGASVTAGQLTAVIKKNSNDIASVIFFRNGVQIYNVPSPSPSGGTESYSDATPFTDNVTFRVDTRDAVVSGDGNTLVQASVSYNFIFARYAGAGAPALNAAGIVALTKSVSNPSNAQRIDYTLAVGEVPYFAYPNTIGALTQITDENGFDVTSGFTERSVSLTNVYGQSQTYRVYERNAPAGSAGSTFYTFRR